MDISLSKLSLLKIRNPICGAPANATRPLPDPLVMGATLASTGDIKFSIFQYKEYYCYIHHSFAKLN